MFIFPKGIVYSYVIFKTARLSESLMFYANFLLLRIKMLFVISAVLMRMHLSQ